jgi:prepilin-type processing-associated H-X9-DG protein
VREAACRTACLSNQRQIGIALHHCYHDHARLPDPPHVPGRPFGPLSNLSWMVHLLPYVECDELYTTSVQACQVERNVLRNPPHVGLSKVIKLYLCPSDSRLSTPLTDQYGVEAGFASYLGIEGTLPAGAQVGQLGVFTNTGRGRQFDDTRDGLTNTLMVGERPPPDTLQAGWWYPSFYMDGHNRGPNAVLILGLGPDPLDYQCRGVRGRWTFGPGRTDNPCDRFHLWSFHPGGANFLFADGSARFLSYSVEPLIMALASRKGGEVVSVPD